MQFSRKKFNCFKKFNWFFSKKIRIKNKVIRIYKSVKKVRFSVKKRNKLN